jgi:hypothetical protein
MDANLDSIMKNDMWCWKPARSDTLVESQSRLLEVQLGVVDRPIRTISRSGSYVSANTWNFFRQRKYVVAWWSLI